MKKYNTLFVVVVSILAVLLLTWVLPITYLNGTLMEEPTSQAGIANLFMYPTYTFYIFVYTFVYLLAVGGLYGLLNRTGAYRSLLDKIVNYTKKHEIVWLVVTVLLISIVVSFTGFTIQALIVLPLIASLVLLLGYDKMTAAMITVGSIATGIIGTTFSSLVAGTFNNILGTTYTDLVIVKAILLVVADAILILNIIHHAKNVEKKKNYDESFLVPEKTSGKVKVWPLVTILSCFVILLLIGTINWSAFNIDFFSNTYNSFSEVSVLSKYVLLIVSVLVILYNVLVSVYKRRKEAKKDEKLLSKKRLIVTIIFAVIGFLALLKICLEDIFNVTDIMNQGIKEIGLETIINNFTFGKLLGRVGVFGNWDYVDYVAFILLTCVVIKFAYHISFEDTVSHIGEGFKKVLYGVLVAMLSYTVLVIILYHPIGLTILKPLLDLTDGLNIFIYPLCTFISAVFNSDFTCYEYAVLNLNYAVSYFTSTNVFPLCGLITQAMYGLAILVAPTSVVLLFSLSVLDIKYTTWLKKMWLPILELLLVIFVSFIIVLQFLI